MADFTQKEGEKVAYKVDTTGWDGTPTNVSVKAWLKHGGEIKTEVTSTVFPANSPSVSGDDITLSLLQSLAKNTLYEIEVLFDTGGNTLKKTFEVFCQ